MLSPPEPPGASARVNRAYARDRTLVSALGFPGLVHLPSGGPQEAPNAVLSPPGPPALRPE